MKLPQITLILGLTVAHATYASFFRFLPVAIWQGQYFSGGVRDAVEFILKPEALSDVKRGLDPALFVAKSVGVPMHGGWFADGFAGIRGALVFTEPRYAEGVLASLRGYATEMKSANPSPETEKRLGLYRASLYSRLYDIREANPKAFDQMVESGGQRFREHVENVHNVVIPKITQASDKQWAYLTPKQVAEALKKTGADFEEHVQYIRASLPNRQSAVGSSYQIPVSAGPSEVKA